MPNGAHDHHDRTALSGERAGSRSRGPSGLVLSALALGMLVAMLTQSIVAPALPTIVGELGGQDDLPWVMTAQMLAMTASTPLWGKVADIHGRKLLFQVSVVVLIIGSVASGAAQSMLMLIAGRSIQGLGAGGVICLTMALAASIVPARERGRYQGYLSSVMLISSVGGPLVGGVVVDTLSWRWCFYIAIPIAVVVMVIVQRVLQLPHVSEPHPLDLTGATLLVGSVTAAVVVSSFGGRQWAWTSAPAIGLGITAIALGVLFVLQERRTPEPLLPLDMFRSPEINRSTVGLFVVGIAMSTTMLFMPQYLQITRGVTPTQSGLLLTPQMIGMALTGIVAGRLISRTGRYRHYPIMGMVFLGVSLVWLSFLDTSTPLVLVFGALFCHGVGLGLAMQILTLIIQNSVEWHELGVATSATQFFRSLGGVLALPVFGAVMNNRLAYHLPRLVTAAGGEGPVDPNLIGSPAQIAALPEPVRDAVTESFARGLHVVFLSAAPFAVAGLLAVLWIRHVPLRTEVGGPALDEADVAEDAAASASSLSATSSTASS